MLPNTEGVTSFLGASETGLVSAGLEDEITISSFFYAANGLLSIFLGTSVGAFLSGNSGCLGCALKTSATWSFFGASSTFFSSTLVATTGAYSCFFELTISPVELLMNAVGLGCSTGLGCSIGFGCSFGCSGSFLGSGGATGLSSFTVVEDLIQPESAGFAGAAIRFKYIFLRFKGGAATVVFFFSKTDFKLETDDAAGASILLSTGAAWVTPPYFSAGVFLGGMRG